jgi:glycine/D-amino acid oxidase-like deaminating enzyme
MVDCFEHRSNLPSVCGANLPRLHEYLGREAGVGEDVQLGTLRHRRDPKPRGPTVAGEVFVTSDVNVLWKDTAPTPRFQVTEPPTETVDLAVVGGGLAGMWTAHRFLEARPDASVVVIERDRVGSGASGRAGGYLNPRYGTTVHHILSHGKEEGRASYHVGESAITELERFVADRRIGCDFQRASHITFAMSGLQERRLRKDLDATREMGIDTMREITPAELDKQVRLPASYVAYDEQNCALVRPLKLLRGLTAHCVARGVGVVEECELLRVRHERTHVTAHTTRGDVKARAVVLATGTWAGEQRALKRQVPRRARALHARLQRARSHLDVLFRPCPQRSSPRGSHARSCEDHDRAGPGTLSSRAVAVARRTDHPPTDARPGRSRRPWRLGQVGKRSAPDEIRHVTRRTQLVTGDVS